MLKTKLVALTGRARAGKDHVASILELPTLSVAEPLVEITEAFLGSCDKNKPLHRRFMQLLGAWGRGEKIKSPQELPTQEDVTAMIHASPKVYAPKTYQEARIDWSEFGKRPDFWLQIALAKAKKRISKDGFGTKIAVCNVRFENELIAFQRLGFLHLHIMCSDQTLEKRRGVGIDKTNDNDITEAFAKKLDKTMVGPQVIWNDPHMPCPKGMGYTPSVNLHRLAKL